MKRFQLHILAAFVAGISPVAFFSVMPAQANECSTGRPLNARSHWSYRLLDGRKCWYAGKPMLSKSMLHWSPARTAQAHKDDITSATFDKGKANYGDLDVSEARRLKVLTDENAKLKKLLAEASPARKLNVLSANYNLLDAQASFQDDSFEARWRARFLEAIKK